MIVKVAEESKELIEDAQFKEISNGEVFEEKKAEG